jgi:hypothetical protein
LNHMSDLEKKLETSINQLIDKECWGIVAGEGTGSFVNLEIGEKIRRNKEIENPALETDVRQFEGQYSLSLECAWRLDSTEAVICGASDDNSKDGKMLDGLRLLIGRRISRINLSKPGLDLDIEFSKDLTLKVFCDQTNENDQNDNYMLFTPDQIITVSYGSRLECEPHRRP